MKLVDSASFQCLTRVSNHVHVARLAFLGTLRGKDLSIQFQATIRIRFHSWQGNISFQATSTNWVLEKNIFQEHLAREKAKFSEKFSEEFDI